MGEDKRVNTAVMHMWILNTCPMGFWCCASLLSQ